MWFLLGILFLTSGIVYLSREIKFIIKVNDLYIISFVRLLYSCSCGFFAALMCFLYEFQGVELRLGSLVLIDYNKNTLVCLYVFWVCSIIGYVALTTGYCCLGNKKLLIKISDNRTLYKKGLTDQQVFWTALACLAVGVIALLIWTSDIGGIQKYIELASAIRGDYNNVYGNTHMGWRKIARVLLPATYMFYFLTLKNGRKKPQYYFFVIIALVFSIIFLLCNDGRLTTAMFFLILVVGFYRYGEKRNKDIKKQFFQFGILLAVTFVLLANLDNISYFIRYGGIIVTRSSNDDGVLITLMNEFSYIYKSAITAVSNCFPDGRLMLVDDIMFGITTYLPGGSLFGSYTQVSLYNTILCTGNANSMAGSIPCDIIALSLYDLSYIGVIVIPFITGLVIRLIENHYSGRKDNPLSQTFYYGLVLIFIRVVTYCEVYDFITALFPYVVLWIASVGINWSSSLLKKE